MTRLKIKAEEIVSIIAGAKAEFPLYTTQLMNIANQNVGGTRPRIVGQLTNMIQEFSGKSLEEWQAWYIDQKPGAVEEATDKIWTMVQNLQEAITKIDREMVERWVRDLLFVKTYIGLRFQEAILARIANEANAAYHLAPAEEEAKGIDGYIGGRPLSIKPLSYRSKNMLRENIDCEFVFYEKKKDGIVIEFEPWWEELRPPPQR